MQQTRLTRIIANLVGIMLFVQVILGGSTAILGNPPIIYHMVWGTITLITLIITSVLTARTFGTGSSLFRITLAAIVDFVIQVILGFIAMEQSVAVLVHLTNAFVLTVIVSNLIRFADVADQAALTGAQASLTGKSSV